MPYRLFELWDSIFSITDCKQIGDLQVPQSNQYNEEIRERAEILLPSLKTTNGMYCEHREFTLVSIFHCCTVVYTCNLLTFYCSKVIGLYEGKFIRTDTILRFIN